MPLISSKDAALRLKISIRRVQQLIKDGRLPARMIGGVYMIESENLVLVKNRKTGRPRKLASKATRK